MDWTKVAAQRDGAPSEPAERHRPSPGEIYECPLYSSAPLVIEQEIQAMEQLGWKLERKVVMRDYTRLVWRGNSA